MGFWAVVTAGDGLVIPAGFLMAECGLGVTRTDEEQEEALLSGSAAVIFSSCSAAQLIKLDAWVCLVCVLFVYCCFSLLLLLFLFLLEIVVLFVYVFMRPKQM
jgi:hypothetical protein